MAEGKRAQGVESLRRGLLILTEVNRSGGARPGEIAKALSLPRPTVYRLLETLEELGFVARSGSDDRIRVTIAARGLGDGYDSDVHFAQSGGPILRELSRRLIWPCDLVVYEDLAMVIQETTHAASPLSIDRAMIGRRLPILRSSCGRAFLAACPSEEAEKIIEHLRRRDDPEDRPFLEPVLLDRMLKETRARGYGIRHHENYIPKTSSIAVAVRRDNAALGCITVIWITSALPLSEAVAQFYEPLSLAATQIAETFGD